MLGDTAVAVHPEDDRYKHLIGEELVHPFFPDREMKIIADDILVDKDFGTGAVKITPCHDPNDFACGERHNLKMINIFNDDGTLNENGGEFKGIFFLLFLYFFHLCYVFLKEPFQHFFDHYKILNILLRLFLLILCKYFYLEYF